jgi:four helix bundle protein
MVKVADWSVLSVEVGNLPCLGWEMSTLNSQSLQRRLTAHASRTLALTSKLPKLPQANHISRQLIRSATATAANYAEARAAESRPDFIHKIRIVLKELNETGVWLDFILECSLLAPEMVAPVAAENEELCRIIAASLKTAGGFDRS